MRQVPFADVDGADRLARATVVAAEKKNDGQAGPAARVHDGAIRAIPARKGKA